jgi:hypothetical protein
MGINNTLFMEIFIRWKPLKIWCLIFNLLSMAKAAFVTSVEFCCCAFVLHQNVIIVVLIKFSLKRTFKYIASLYKRVKHSSHAFSRQTIHYSLGLNSSPVEDNTEKSYYYDYELNK